MTREEAIEVYNGLINEKIKAAFEFFAPELSESEDERIIKTLQEYVKNRNWNLNGPSQAEVLAWLEKQKETVSTENQTAEVGDDETEVQKAYREGKIAGRQEVIDHPDYYQLIKPEEQDSEEVFNKIDNSFRKGRKVGFQEGVESVKREEEERIIKEACSALDSRGYAILASRLKSIRLQPKQEWSEEDERMLNSALWHVSHSVSNGSSTDYNCSITEWLKNLRPSWKPSEDLLDALDIVANLPELEYYGGIKDKIRELYKQLKKRYESTR